MSGPRVAAVVLAAGGSARMGRPKVLLEVDGEPLVRRVARNAIGAGLAPVIVIAGSEIANVTAALAQAEATVVQNRDWSEGLGSSIRCGIESLEDSAADGVLLLLADQPFVTIEHLRSLLDAFAAGSDPVATRYGEGRGVPALFGARWFAELRALSGDRGAREILDRAGAATVGDGEPPADIDTREDYERALRR